MQPAVEAVEGGWIALLLPLHLHPVAAAVAEADLLPQPSGVQPAERLQVGVKTRHLHHRIISKLFFSTFQSNFMLRGLLHYQFPLTLVPNENIEKSFKGSEL